MVNKDIHYFLRESGARLTQTLFMEAHYIFSKEDLEKFFQLATEWERNGCILELERNADKTLEEIIAAIRARGESK